MIPSVSSYSAMHYTSDIPARKIMMVTMRHGTSHESSRKQPLRTLLRRVFRGFIHHDVPVSTKLASTTEKDVPVLTFINDASEEGDFVTVVPLARRKRMTSGPCILCTAVLDYPMESSKLQRQGGARRREASRALRVMHRHPSQGYYPPTPETIGSIEADELTATSLIATDETAHVEGLSVLGVRQRRSSAWDRFLDGGKPTTVATAGASSCIVFQSRIISISVGTLTDDDDDDHHVHSVTSSKIERLLTHRHFIIITHHHTSTATTNMMGVASLPVGRTVSAHAPGRSPNTVTAMAATALRRMSAVGLEIMTPLRSITPNGHTANVTPLQKMERIDDEDTSQSSSANNSPQATESEDDTDE
ncbi:hypothetical protein BDF22DRAFT_652018 [Syncephalis plumigaleata]|nr:hypothetical protein BDF22DRAFT_652018 [Syncephalis plumigaleata]